MISTIVAVHPAAIVFFMKRIALFLLALSLFAPLRAQQVQNKPFDVTLRDYTIDEIIQMFGKPTQIDSGLIDVGLAVEYPHAKFYYFGTWDDWGIEMPEGAPDRYVPDGFWTDSPDFCILSDCFPGGIRVGDRIERIRSLDIVHSKPGKGREGNGLRKADHYSDLDCYVILGEEYDSFYLEVKDSVVCAVNWETPQDWDRPEGGVLWRVEGKDLPAPSYILGVFPHAPADVCRRIYGLADAWKSARKVYWQDPDQGPWGRKMTGSMHLRDGKELADQYEWSEYVDIQDYVKKVTGFRPEDLSWTPDGLTRFLLSHLMEQAMPELPDGKDDMAAHLYKKALADGKEVHVLPPTFMDISTWDKEIQKHHDWDLLRFVWYPEGEPEFVKERIRHLYDAYLQENLEEICWTLDQDGPIHTNVKMDHPTDWSKDLGQAIREAPTLIIVDFTNLRHWDLMISLVDGLNLYRIQPVKPTQKN